MHSMLQLPKCKLLLELLSIECVWLQLVRNTRQLERGHQQVINCSSGGVEMLVCHMANLLLQSSMAATAKMQHRHLLSCCQVNVCVYKLVRSYQAALIRPAGKLSTAEVKHINS